MRGNRAITVGAVLVGVVIGAAILTAPASSDRFVWIIGHRVLDVSTGRVVDDRTVPP